MHRMHIIQNTKSNALHKKKDTTYSYRSYIAIVRFFFIKEAVHFQFMPFILFTMFPTSTARLLPPNALHIYTH